ncbi:nucleotidyltransferase domain-containing protein [Kribbella italica]|uniref:Putative NADPH-quinone reductase n=1 Tax=Kribbella italica TaxID=1540520 RepID=A0A7W9J252_9ACTN|nr:nucleotidyltransferase domain-containing protein [Kribbella italica]MBB5834281.1 putative NADPH-quinone reductase [Kribbella italica]
MTDHVSDEAVQQLLDGFVASTAALPAQAIWIHGSLALGDFVPSRSDLDLVCVLPGLVDPAAIKAIHRPLTSPLGRRLHCTYVPVDGLADPAVRHPTFAQEHYLTRPVTPVTRRELALSDLSLFGPPPSSLLPATTDAELADFVRADLLTFWYPVTAKRTPWLRDIWIDLAMVTLARAETTLRTGALITKQAALAHLPTLGAPAAVVHDIHQRRYGGAVDRSLSWRRHRAELTRTYLRAKIPAVAG